MSSEGKFSGVLNNIDVDGETTTPDFSLSIAGHPLLLKTDFQATVDEITGDTLLPPVTAQFLNTILVCNGGIVKAFNRPGREIVLDVKTDHALVEDLWRLAVKSDRPPMTGAVRLTTKFDLPPGKRGNRRPSATRRKVWNWGGSVCGRRNSSEARGSQPPRARQTGR